MNLRKLGITITIALIGLTACTTTQTHDEIKLAQPLAAGEGIVLLADESSHKVHEYSDEDVDDCLGDGMRDVNPQLEFVSAKSFRVYLYPYFSANTIPHTTEEYQALINKPIVRHRIAVLGVRYLVVMIEADTNNDWHNHIFCGGGYGGGGCLGLAWWNRKTALNAQIWDLKKGSLGGTVETKATGKGILPALIVPFPIYMPATESASCKELGARLAKALTNPP